MKQENKELEEDILKRFPKRDNIGSIEERDIDIKRRAARIGAQLQQSKHKEELEKAFRAGNILGRTRNIGKLLEIKKYFEDWYDKIYKK